MRVFKFLSFLIPLLLMATSCTGSVDLKTAKSSEGMRVEIEAFDLKGMKISKGADTEVTLNYRSRGNTHATGCAATFPKSIKIVRNCQCDAGGHCTVKVSSEVDSTGPASFQFSVNREGLNSNIATAHLNVE